MLDKLISVIKECIFPSSHLTRFLVMCNDIEFESKLTPRPQLNTRMFYPFYYKNKFVTDCIIELKERNSAKVAERFGKILARWIVREIEHIKSIQEINNQIIKFYLIPIPQHITRTREKGFCHTTTLTCSILEHLKRRYQMKQIYFSSNITKIKNIRKLHTGMNKQKRSVEMKYSMKADLSKFDLCHSYFFLIDDVYTSGATFKEARRSLIDCGALEDHIFFVSIAH